MCTPPSELTGWRKLASPVGDFSPERDRLGVSRHEVETAVDARKADLRDRLGEAAVRAADPKRCVGRAEGHLFVPKKSLSVWTVAEL